MGDLIPIRDLTTDAAKTLQQRCARLAESAPPAGTYATTAAEGLTAEADNRAYVESIWRRAIPQRFWAASPDDLDGELAVWDGTTNVLLLGDVGVGKTHTAVALARRAHDLGKQVLFRSAAVLLDSLRPSSDDPQALDRAVTTDMLVLDDLAAERPTDWTAERMSIVIDERWKHLRPTIATSNLTPERLESAVGKRAYSRLYHGATRLTLAGVDRRRGDAA